MAAALTFIGLGLTPLALFSETPAVIRQSLDGDWQFRQAGLDKWHPARVPGCVHLDLLAAGIIPDPFYRDNELRVQWIENADWEYRREFKLSTAVLGKSRIELVALGLDTFAAIFLNGQKIAQTDNMFRGWRFDIKPYVHAGGNEIVIRFDSPVARGKALEAGLPHKLPGNSPHVRKAPYHFGWDWGPRLVTSGIWRPVAIEAWDIARIGEVELSQDFVQMNNVLVRTKFQVLADRSHTIAIKTTFTGYESFTYSEMADLKPGENTSDKTFRVIDPQLWWPAGMGPQNLYTVTIELYLRGRLLDVVEKRIGFRTMVLEQVEDEWGKSFRFAVNGVPFFAKGGNWIPADSFPSRVTRAKYEALLRDCAAANMNMLRVWGGGIYESPDFYDLCDELGLVVWQDFMFACSMVPGDPAFLDNVRAEAEYVIKDLRHHASIALWCGNNECEEGWFHWGWKEQYPATVWDDYQKIFNEILPKAVEMFDPRRPYWPSSPHSEQTGDPRSDRSGDMHYWGVWHGREPFTEYRKKFHRFFSEFGFQSFPLLETVRMFTRPEDWNIASPVMERHQKHPEGNRLILLYLLDHYRLAKDFPSLLWLSQVLQAEGMKTAVEHFRSQMPRTMGALYWQVNDCWPVASWSGTDYYGNWKALHYYARRFFSPLLLAPVDDDKTLRIFAVSDLGQPVVADLVVGVHTYEGKTIQEGKTSVRIEPRSSHVVLNKPLDELRQGLAPEEIYLSAELKKGNETLSRNIFHFSALKRVDLPDPGIRTEVLNDGEKTVVRLTASRLAKDVYLSVPGLKGRFSDNFFDLLPGKPLEVTFLLEAAVDPAAFRQALKVTSLKDTY
ncbi:MAG: ABC transporter permease [Candidatus Aminicenantes bacterium RBG_16_63_16]|nr:MAG: ABC transporter permease [Candidatus Aminicenantes bacterium RBG_16_63_16]